MYFNILDCKPKRRGLENVLDGTVFESSREADMGELFKDEPVILIDAYAWIFRAYYALPDFRNSKGQPTSVVHGFLSVLPKLAAFVEKECGVPGEFAVFFDRGGPQERLAAYADYKANRPETPEDLKTQVPWIEEALEGMGIPQVAVDGIEADDSIAAAALRMAGEGRRVLIASNDKDFFQILTDQIRMVRPGRLGEEFRIYDRCALKEKFGLDPDRMTDFYALVGDAVDNVPGVKGIGEKTAAKLLQKFPSLEALYENLERLPKATARALKEQRAEAYLSRDLVRLRTNVAIDVVPAPLDPVRFDRDRLEALFSKLELRRLADKFLGTPRATRVQE